MYSKLFCFFILLSFITVSCVDNCGDLFGDNLCEDCINSDKIGPNTACTREFRPVCGCDGVQYSNSCIAESSGITSWSSGECD